ncbi:peptide chain release factor N(5)-glutamine methyltransferase [Legionella waltersii]|uniref:Release factor glutamine methyltransferase n=1 Tax=Legionella waltersii TaxID=66969 RepID=A0A0W1AGK7_9GAMM|nr:peptide chain release factor N(5)-glutamine methyltransferase [Legionella waltersii]KTD80493.1 protein methyltransferase HemK [Legionella waltersii]SNV09681.1 HemK protein [Legionella waltersii]
MTDIQQALKQATARLNTVHESARLESELLLAYVLKKKRTHLYTYPEQELKQEELELFFNLLEKRLLGEPIAYLIQEKEFWSLPFKVTPDTLIPRPETELLVELALKLIPNRDKTTLLDLGTGSGAIAISIAKERPNWIIHACDSSKKALNIAIENAKSLSVENIHFFHSNWFSELPQLQYHAILSNPPYIAQDDVHLKQGDVRFEPICALVSGKDGLSDLQYLLNEGLNYLLPNGLMLVEHGFEQKDKLSAILNGLGYLNTHCWQDLQGHDRVSGGWYPS